MKKYTKYFLLSGYIVLCIIHLTGCSYYANQARQANLDVDLAKYRSTMQQPATTTTPAHYVICDDAVYPCNLTTPIHLAEIADTYPAQPILSNPTKHYPQKGKPYYRHHHKRTPPCTT